MNMKEQLAAKKAELKALEGRLKAADPDAIKEGE